MVEMIAKPEVDEPDAQARPQIDVEDLADRRSLCEVFQETAARVPERLALCSMDGSMDLTWSDYAARVESIAGGLAAWGVEDGSSVAIMSGTSMEFHLVDTAVLHLGAMPVSIYHTLPVDDIEHQLRDSGATVVVAGPEMLELADEARRRVGIEHLVVLGAAGGEGAASTLAELEAQASEDFDFASRWRAVTPDHLATLIYTSGTTGPPKGVELSHRAILGNQRAFNQAVGLIDGAATLSFLPMAHVAERQLSHYRPMVGGLTVTPVASLDQIPAALAKVRPDYFFSPPRLWDKFRAALLAGVSSDPQAAAALSRIVELGTAEVDSLEGGEPLTESEQAELAGLRGTAGTAMLGKFGLDRVDVALTGAAPVPRDLVVFWLSLGMTLVEAYGLSEAGAFGAFNRPDRYRPGTVGLPLPGVEHRVLDDGELLLRSPWMMTGYRNDPEKTAGTVDSDGWLHTGDVCHVDADGFVSIIDRKKEIIINAAGKNMSPANIEAKIRNADPIVAQAVVVGERRPYNVAIIVIDAEVATTYAASQGVEASTLADAASEPVVLQRVAEAVEKANAKMSRVEQIKRHVVLTTDWAPAGDELTPTMKLRRVAVSTKYAEQIDALYQ